MNKIYPNYQDHVSTILTDLENMKYGDQITVLDSTDFDTSLLGMLQRRDIEDVGMSSNVRDLIKRRLILGFHNGFIYKSKKSRVSYNLVCMYLSNGSVVISYPPRGYLAVAVTRVDNFLKGKDITSKPVSKLFADGKMSKVVTLTEEQGNLVPSNCVAIDYLHMYERFDKGVYKGNQLYGLFPQYL